MPTCAEGIIAANEACGVKNLGELCALMGVGIRKPTGISVPETVISRNIRYPGPFFLYDCEEAKCPPQKCSTLTHCAELIWKVPKITTGHKTTITAIESPRHSSVTAIPLNLRGKERPFLYRVFGPDGSMGVKGWRGYGGEKNPEAVLAGKECPDEVPEEFRWGGTELEEFRKEYPGRESKPMTVILIKHNPGYKDKIMPRVGPSAEVIAKREKPARKKEIKEEGTGHIGALEFRWVKTKDVIRYYTPKGEEIPVDVINQMKKAEEAIRAEGK